MFIVGSAEAKIPQKAGSCLGQEVFKSTYFGPVPQMGKIQALPTQKHSHYLDLSPLFPVSLGAHMLVRECGLFAERGGESGEVFTQTGIDLQSMFLLFLQLSLVLIPRVEWGAGINCTTPRACQEWLKWQG